ncbi:LysR substrate-binding domain-containing protein [Ferrovibrio xuzhouensis]|uniref:LysR substrate-binding domain-containing protein n=1 Tax=Ferrovibrio xuzhouensis TaxID=1576914 RepID=A0ABV7VLI6_9PROT
MSLSLKERLPPANSLIAFEAAARNGSFVGAARTLSVTPAAVTRHIDRIEESLGVSLFQPDGRGRALTEAGQQLFEAVTIGLEHIASVASRIRQQEHSPSLTIASPLAFASLWLMPRIASFRRAHPDISMRFVTADADLDPSQEGLSLAVRYGSGDWPNLRVRPLLQPHVFPVCSPRYLDTYGNITSVEDLAGHTLLDREGGGDGSFSIGWTRWLSCLDNKPRRMPDRIYFSSYEVIIRAALAGQGIALGVDVLVKDLLDQNLLACPFASEVRWKEAYYLVSPKNEPTTKQMRLFSEWLFNEIATSDTVDPGRTQVAAGQQASPST